MAITIHHKTEEPERQESFVHFLAREIQWILRILVIVSAVTTVLLMFTIFYWAILPAMILLAAYCLLLIADYIEFRTHKPGDPGWEAVEVPERAATAAETRIAEVAAAEHEASEKVRDAVKARLTKTIIGILASIGLVAIIVAGIFLGREVVALGGMILFAYWLFIAGPLWLGWLEDEAEEEAHRAEEELR